MIYEIDEKKIRAWLEELLKSALNDIISNEISYDNHRDITFLAKNLSKYEKVKLFARAYGVDVDKYDLQIKECFEKGLLEDRQ